MAPIAARASSSERVAGARSGLEDVHPALRHNRSHVVLAHSCSLAEGREGNTRSSFSGQPCDVGRAHRSRLFSSTLLHDGSAECGPTPRQGLQRAMSVPAGSERRSAGVPDLFAADNAVVFAMASPKARRTAYTTAAAVRTADEAQRTAKAVEADRAAVTSKIGLRQPLGGIAPASFCWNQREDQDKSLQPKPNVPLHLKRSPQLWRWGCLENGWPQEVKHATQHASVNPPFARELEGTHESASRMPSPPNSARARYHRMMRESRTLTDDEPPAARHRSQSMTFLRGAPPRSPSPPLLGAHRNTAGNNQMWLQEKCPLAAGTYFGSGPIAAVIEAAAVVAKGAPQPPEPLQAVVVADRAAPAEASALLQPLHPLVYGQPFSTPRRFCPPSRSWDGGAAQSTAASAYLAAAEADFAAAPQRGYPLQQRVQHTTSAKTFARRRPVPERARQRTPPRWRM